MLSNHRVIVWVTLVVSFSAAPLARADRLGGVTSGLGALGFDLRGQHNIASGGVDLLVGRNFLGNPINFGAADLTLQGPVSFDLSTGGRIIPGFDLTFSTALDGNSTPVPLSYVFNSDAGPQLAGVSGTLLVDAGLSVNKFGYYKANLTYSSRQQVARRGRFATDDTTNDFDVGPVNLSGNLYADALAIVTQPLFSVTNTVNVFSAFSGQGSLSDMLLASSDGARLQLAAGTSNGSTTASRIRTLEDRFSDLPAGRSAIDVEPPSAGVVVPEPTVLVLMLVGLPAAMRRGR